MGMCKWFFKDTTKIQNGRHRSTLIFFVGAKTLKTNVRNYSNFTITFPTIWRCAGDFFLNIVEIQSGRHGSTSIFLLALKLKKLKAEIIQNKNYSI